MSYALAPAHSDGAWTLSVKAWRQLSFSKWNEVVRCKIHMPKDIFSLILPQVFGSVHNDKVLVNNNWWWFEGSEWVENSKFNSDFSTRKLNKQSKLIGLMGFAEFDWFCQFERNVIKAIILQGWYWFSASGLNGAHIQIQELLWEMLQTWQINPLSRCDPQEGCVPREEAVGACRSGWYPWQLLRRFLSPLPNSSGSPGSGV